MSELLLNSEVPLNGVRQFLVFNQGCRCSTRLRLGERTGCEVWLNPTIRQEVRSDIRRIEGKQIYCSAVLRRQVQNADVVIEDVVVDAETSTNGGLPTCSRRVSYADSRAEVLVLRL